MDENWGYPHFRKPPCVIQLTVTCPTGLNLEALSCFIGRGFSHYIDYNNHHQTSWSILSQHPPKTMGSLRSNGVTERQICNSHRRETYKMDGTMDNLNLSKWVCLKHDVPRNTPGGSSSLKQPQFWRTWTPFSRPKHIIVRPLSCYSPEF